MVTRPRRVTLVQHLMQHQPAGTKGDFTLLMMALQTAVKAVEKSIRRAGLYGTFGSAGGSNSTGDDQQKLDVISNRLFKEQLIACEKIAILGSEEEETAVLVDEEQRGTYAICFDPLDGSSNIDANVSVGSIWGIWKLRNPQSITSVAGAGHRLLQSGDELVSAGYAMYGSATNLVMACKDRVDGFTLDSTIGEFLLTHPRIRVPSKRTIYSLNEGNAALWEPWLKDYVDFVKHRAKPGYSLRYIGSMVADVHRTLLYGGIFIYPKDKKKPSGKLRLLYEAAPMAYIMEKAGGVAVTGKEQERILAQRPTKLHERVPVFMGSSEEVKMCVAFGANSSKL